MIRRAFLLILIAGFLVLGPAHTHAQFPCQTLFDTAQTLPDGLYRICVSGKVLKIDQNTASNGSFSTTNSILAINNGGISLPSAKVFSPFLYGAKCTGYPTDDHQAFQDMTSAINSAGGGFVVLPLANCYIGNSLSSGGIFTFNVGNVGIACPVRLGCKISYTHVMSTTGTGLQFFNTAGFMSTKLSNIELSGFILQDLQTTQDGFNGAGLSIYGLYGQISIHDIEFLDIKGNSSIYSVGADHVWLYNSIFTGTSAGGWSYLSGVNYSGDYWWIWGNHLDGGYLGAAIAGSGGDAHNYIWYNELTANLALGGAPLGGAGICYGGSDYYLLNNTITDHRAYDNSITSITRCEVGGSTPLNGVTISGNNVDNPANRNLSIAGDNMTSPAYRDMTITINRFKGTIEVHTDLTITGTWLIKGNSFDLTDNIIGDHRAATGWENTPIDSDAIVDIEDNPVIGYCKGGGMSVCPHNPSFGSFVAMFFIDFTSWTNAKSRNVIVRNNRLGQTLFDSQNGQIDGHTAVNTVSVNAGNLSAIQTATVLGALPGDTVRIIDSDGTNLPAGITPTGFVSAADTVSWWEVNNTGSNYTHSSQVLQIYDDRNN